VSLDYSVRGTGEPLVLIHGLFGTRENLGAIARHLAEAFTVYSVDLLNHGRSAHRDDLNLPLLAESIHHWMEEVGLDAAHVFGHSLGGKAAMELALSEPERVKKLIVADIAPVTYENRHVDVFDGLLAIDLQNLQSRAEADAILQRSVPEKPVRSFLLKNLQKDANGNFGWRMNLQGLYKSYPELLKQNSIAKFERPVLFLKAENSDYITVDYREAILSRFPSTDLKVVSNTGHWLHAEKPELIARLIRKFIAPDL